MKRIGQLPVWMVIGGLLFVTGCASLGGNLAKKGMGDSESLADLDADSDQADTSSAGDTDAGGPPSQPGSKAAKGSRSKLAGWMQNKEPKRQTIPLDRTDSKESDDDADESLADEGSNWLKFSDAPMTADSQSPKSAKSSFETTSNPFD